MQRIQPPKETDRIDPGLLVALLGIASAAGYTATNICLRYVVAVDPIWVSCVKAFPTFLASAPFVFVRLQNAQRIFPSRSILIVLIVTAVFGQVGGNVSFQWSLGIIGLALIVPIVLGTMIVMGALMGNWLMGDPMTPRMIFAGIVLLVAIFVLGFGSDAAQQSVTEDLLAEPKKQLGLLGIAAACFSGFAYCCLSFGIRHASRNGTSHLAILCLVSTCGIGSLGALTLIRNGVQPIIDAGFNDYVAMIGAGVCNFLAFIALSKSLELASVFFVNALNATQIAMAAIAGILIFGEPLTVPLAIGTILTIGGLLSMKTQRRKQGSQHTNQDRPQAENEIQASTEKTITRASGCS